MATKELKSIKFPGLEDTYIIPENDIELDTTLQIEGMAADAKSVGDALNQCATIPSNISGNIVSLDDAATAPLNGLKIFGKTTQNGTPTPDSPIPLDTIGSDGSITITINGKNLLNLIDGRESVTSGGVTYTRNDDGSYTRNGTATDTAGNAWLRGNYFVTPNSNNVIIHLLPGESYYIRDCVLFSYYNNTPVGHNGNFYIDPLNYPDGFKVTGVRNPQHDLNKEYSDTIYPAVFLGSSDNINTDYETYIENTAIFSTPNGLPGIPVASGGNYTDSTGQQWICDEIDFANGKYIQRVGYQKITNATYGATFDSYTRFSTTLNGDMTPNNSYLDKSLCSHFKYVDANYSGDYVHFYHWNTGMYFFFPNNIASSQAEIDIWLSNNDLRVAYVLATSIETDLTEEQLAAYAALHTIYPNTTIYNDAGADMEVKYYTPKAAVPMIHDPSNEGKVLAIDEHGCVVLSDDIGGGTIDIDLEGSIEGEITPINADTLGGYTANEYVRKNELSNYNFVTKNYSIVDGPEVPENPTENMIWIQTEEVGTITNNVISRVEPKKRTEGLAWIVVGNNSNVNFHKLKVNDVYVEEVYPISAKIYTNGTWVEHVAQTYQNGEWVHWLPAGALYWHGTQMVEWITKSSANNSWIATPPVYDEDTVTLYQSTYDSYFCGIVTKDKVDITGYTKLVIEFEEISGLSSGASFEICISSAQNNFITDSRSVASKSISSNPGNIIELPFTASGLYYIDLFTIRTPRVVIKRVYLEK